MLICFSIEADPTKALNAIFVEHEDGYIRFGTARSCDPAKNFRLFESWVRFRDYVMEGYVYYSVRLRTVDSSLQIEIETEGSSRDSFVEPAIRACIGSLGLEPST